MNISELPELAITVAVLSVVFFGAIVFVALYFFQESLPLCEKY